MSRRLNERVARIARSRWFWLGAFGLLLAIAAAFVLYSAGTTVDPHEGPFPNYMQNVGR